MPKCMDPVLCYTGQKGRAFRHFSLASPTFKALHQTVFNCGKCIFCRKSRAAELAVRCVLHSSLYKQNCFLTLTYDEKKPEYHNIFDYSDIQEFKKKFRSWVQYHYKKKIQIFNVHEYGKNGKKHWHLVVFNHDFDDKEIFNIKNGNRLYTSKKLDALWGHGFSTIGDVTEASALYQAQYTQKDFKNGNTANNKKSHSKHAGIGRDFFLKNFRQILSLGYIPFSGRKTPIPRYFLKVAHKHWAHFYDTSYFFDNKERKAPYRPFKIGEENKEIADLFVIFRQHREEYLKEIAEAWEEEIEKELFLKDPKDFQLAGENFLYDLNNRTHNSNF